MHHLMILIAIICTVLFNAEILAQDCENIELVSCVSTCWDYNWYPSRNLDIQGNHAFIATGETGLKIFDISDAEFPLPIGCYDDDGRFEAVKIVDEIAYLICRMTIGEDIGVFLRLLDVSDPTDLSLVGTCNIGISNDILNSTGISIFDNYAYVAFTSGWGENGASGTFQVIDISDMTSPEVIWIYEREGFVRNLQVVEDRAFVLGCEEVNDVPFSSLIVFDLSEPENPDSVGAYTWESFGGSMDLFVLEDYVYICCDNEILILDVSTPGNIAEAGSCYCGFGGDGDDFNGIFVTNGFAYISGCAYSGRNYLNRDSQAGEICIIDISDPDNPQDAGGFTYDEMIRSVIVRDDLAYITVPQGFGIFDVSNPEDNMELSTFILQESESVISVGEFAFIENRENGMVVLDIQDPESIIVHSIYNEFSFITCPVIQRSFLYCVCYDDPNFRVVDMSDPRNPVSIGGNYFDFRGRIEDMAIDDNHAYIPAGSSLWIIDISNPESPVLTVEYNCGFHITDILVSEDVGYIGSYNEIMITDLTDKSNPTEVGSFQLEIGFNIKDVVLFNELLYITYNIDGDDPAFFLILNVSDPSNPTLAGSLDIQNTANNIGSSD